MYFQRHEKIKIVRATSNKIIFEKIYFRKARQVRFSEDWEILKNVLF